MLISLRLASLYMRGSDGMCPLLVQDWPAFPVTVSVCVRVYVNPDLEYCISEFNSK